MAPASPSEHEQREMIRRYVDGKQAIERIAKDMFWSYNAVRNALLRHGVVLRPRAHANWRTKRLPHDEYQRTIDLYKSGLTMRQVGEILGVDRRVVGWRLRRAGIPTRGRSK